MKSKFYYHWHSSLVARPVHWMILVFTVAVIGSLVLAVVAFALYIEIIGIDFNDIIELMLY